MTADRWTDDGILGIHLPRARPDRRVWAALYCYVGGGGDFAQFDATPAVTHAELAEEFRRIADTLDPPAENS